MMTNKKKLIHAFFLLLISGQVLALGTSANTTINNTAQINFNVGGIPGSVSDSNAFVIQELLDVNVLWQDAANVNVSTPSTAQVLTYQLTNSGNGSEQFLLSVNSALGGDDFDPVLASVEIWIDDGNGIFESINDTLYTGANGPTLDGFDAANDDVRIFVVADIPSALAVGNVADVRLIAESVTSNTAAQTGVPGAEIVAAGDGGTNANVGLTGADDSADGTYEVIDSAVSIVKSVQIFDGFGGNQPIPGATLRYTLSVQLSGPDNISNLVITDPIPADTTYTANSIALNAAAQTDAADAPIDFSDFNISNANTITIDLSQAGTVVLVPPQTITITFDVTIN